MLLSIFCGVEHHDFYWDDGDKILNHTPRNSVPGLDMSKIQDGEDDKYGGMTHEEMAYLHPLSSSLSVMRTLSRFLPVTVRLAGGAGDAVVGCAVSSCSVAVAVAVTVEGESCTRSVFAFARCSSYCRCARICLAACLSQ